MEILTTLLIVCLLTAVVYLAFQVTALYRRSLANKEKGVSKYLRGVLIIVGGLLIFSLFSPIIFTNKSFDKVLDFSSATGQIGDTIGGLMNPFIAIAAVIVTGLAFYAQYEANKEQRRQFAAQARDTERQRFENIFYELLKVHRDNVTEMNIENSVRGRKAFTSLYYEFRYIYFVFANYYYKGKPFFDRKSRDFELTNIAYIVFFFGLGYNSDNVTKELFNKYENMRFFKEAIRYLKNKRRNYQSYKVERKDMVMKGNGDKATFRVKYQPFNGHTGKLGHYYRHLFQTVKFVDQQNEDIIGPRYDYVKTLRAQLSNFEQLLLYYNSLSVLGTEWLTEKYMFNYEMARNIPLPYANFGIIPQELFKDDIVREFMKFEWTEVIKKINDFNNTINDINTVCSLVKQSKKPSRN